MISFINYFKCNVVEIGKYKPYWIEMYPDVQVKTIIIKANSKQLKTDWITEDII
jgi:hypothetical protein